MPYVKTLWKNRVVERPKTYNESTNQDGSVTHTPAPGEVMQYGTPLNADNMNHMEEGIAALYAVIDQVAEMLDSIAAIFESVDNTEILPIAHGGTGATTAAQARQNLGITLANLSAAAAEHAHALGGADLTGLLPITKGGTGASTAAGARNNLGLGNTEGPLPIANGGTGADTRADAWDSLHVLPTDSHALNDAQKRAARGNINAAKYQAAAVSVPVSAWQGSAAPYTAQINVAIASASNDLIVGVGGSMTDELYAMIATCGIACTGQAAGKITLTAFLDKPDAAFNVNVIALEA